MQRSALLKTDNPQCFSRQLHRLFISDSLIPGQFIEILGIVTKALIGIKNCIIVTYQNGIGTMQIGKFLYHCIVINIYLHQLHFIAVLKKA